ncbi:protein amnionless-like [Saccoglossus kowalevskii]|uniref:Protein amnionless n=1 Tax=Saccoglossus kowalevskii TaxID=10224 RepID=A0ABM0GTQ2_SACKO|nr:PREDICTED: protein amnionless-like [Saccoglossus kowalevskii]
MAWKLVIFTFLAFRYCRSESDTKQWIPNTNYDNPNNWNVGRLPCHNDHIIWTEDVSVFLQTNTTMRELTLPLNGVITLADNTVLSLSDQDVDPECEGTDVEFLRSGTKDWLDPDNWLSSQESILVETEKVPCTFDSVIFPENNKYLVWLDNDITVGKITFDGQAYVNGKSFRDDMMSSDQLRSNSPRNLNILNTECADPSGCACRRNDTQLSQYICSKVNCYEPLCQEGFAPVGGCCQMCGCTLSLQYDHNKFNLNNFKSVLQNNFKVKYSDVRFSTSKTNEGRIQVVATDMNDGKMAISWCNEVKADILINLDEFGVIGVTLQSSGESLPQFTADKPIQSGVIAGIVISILILLALVVVVAFLCRHRITSKGQYPHSGLEFGNAEFINHPTDPTAELKGFDNPMYDTPPNKPVEEAGTKFNPIYTSVGVLDEDDVTMLGFANPVDIETSFTKDESQDDDDDDIKKPIDDDCSM